MLNKDENLEFLKRKIQELKYAKFSAEINSLLQLPNNIITTLKTDSEGNIWFFTSCNGIYASKMDKSFYASLDYYQKGYDCHLHIDGSATIIEDEENREDILPFVIIDNNNIDTHSVVLIKLKIIKAEYFENKQIFTNSIKETINNIFTELFFSNTHKQFHFLSAKKYY